jgi:hypothetical protein
MYCYNSKERLGDRFSSVELQNLSIHDCEQLLSELLSVPEIPHIFIARSCINPLGYRFSLKN